MKLILGEVIMDEEILSVKEQNIKDIENFGKSKKILKKHFKALYENAGMEWTEQNDDEIEFVVNSIVSLSVSDSVNVFLDSLNSTLNKMKPTEITSYKCPNCKYTFQNSKK